MAVRIEEGEEIVMPESCLQTDRLVWGRNGFVGEEGGQDVKWNVEATKAESVPLDFYMEVEVVLTLLRTGWVRLGPRP